MLKAGKPLRNEGTPERRHAYRSIMGRSPTGLLNPTLAIQTKDGKTAAVVLPRGVTLIVSKPKAEDNDRAVCSY
jgi:hypothetical protein